MIKQDHLKYQYYGPQPEAVPADPGYRRCEYDPAHAEVLFDLEHDPDERRDVVEDAAYAGALAAFRQRRAALGYDPDRTR